MSVRYEMSINDGTKITFGEDFNPNEVAELLHNRDTHWVVLGGHLIQKHTILNTYKIEIEESAAE